MVPFIEPRVSLNDTTKIDDFDKIAIRLGIIGYAILNQKYKKETIQIGRSYHTIEHISRFEINDNNIENIRKLLPNKRYQFELLSVKTTSAKVAQWVVKDNRVDILSIPFDSIRDIITQPLANVAAENKTFIELILNPLIFDQKINKAVFLRYLRRIFNILLKENTPFILSCDVITPFMFRSKRSIIALAKTIGVPDIITKRNMIEFYKRITINREKLSNKMIAPGIWLSNDKIKNKDKFYDKKINLDKIIDMGKNEMENITSEYKNAIEQEKQRYLLFEIIKESKDLINEKDFMDSFWELFANYYGLFNSSQSGIYLTKYDEINSIGILRCSHQSVNSVRTTLSLIVKINKMNVIIHVMKTSGTLKNLINIINNKE